MASYGDERCFGNAMSDAERDEEGTQLLLARALTHLTETLNRRLDEATASQASVYVGRGGVAVFFLRLAQYRAERGETQAATSALTLARVELDAARVTRHRARGTTFLEGAVGLHAVRASVAAASGRHADAARAAARVTEAEQDVAQLPPDDCELLYGRAGYLHACLVARQAAGAACVPDAVIVRTALAILDSGAAAADAAGPAFAQKWGLLFRWKGADYLGAAHGLCGIVTTLLQAEAALQNAGWRLPQDAASRLRAATLALAASVMPSGNIPTRATGRDADDRLVHWCHGAPGLLLLAAHSAAAHERGSSAGVPYARIAAQLDVAADCVWQRGLLHKGVGLCHGVAGNAYALLAHWRASGNERSLRRAQCFAGWAATHLAPLQRVPDRPHSLYEGSAGLAVLCADLLRDPARARMPGAEL